MIPVLLGLVAQDGKPMKAACERVNSRSVFLFDKAEDSITFTGVSSRPVPSVFRGFSAPVKVSLDLSNEELIVLFRHDTDSFNRWQAAQTVAMRTLVALSTGMVVSEEELDTLAAAFCAFIESDALRDPAFAALVLSLPSEADIAQEIGKDVNPGAIHRARKELRQHLGRRSAGHLTSFHRSLAATGAYTPDAASTGRRALRNAALDLLAAADPQAGEKLASEQFDTATNMTDRLASLGVLMTIPGQVRENAVADFEERYRNEPLVLDKWFMLQAAIPEDTTLDRVKRLMEHPAFSMSNPNRVRSLIGSFAMLNQVQFNREDGAGYAFLASIVLRADEINPQLASRLLTAFSTWKMMESTRRSHARRALQSIAEKSNLSRDVGDIVNRTLEESADA